ncbi:hypothetical protein RB2150_06298 [Rhodobacterales bacterium HTCC2150]|nr:hypothetical protein RB2150_06298 [Rhodobacterales bacterium HTCC2150] [Rhodobacteraceae bacterium HTCC2150]
MHLDVRELQRFYYRTKLGRAAQKAIRDQVVAKWPEAKGLTVAGYGFAAPMLRPYLGQARRLLALMPGPQGVMHWPVGVPNVSLLCEESFWPVTTGSLDRLIVLHGLETSENPDAILQECHRALGPGGRVLFIVPNRAGLWSRSDKTPFGYGRPYSPIQLDKQLRAAGFTPESHKTMLFSPPSNRRFWLKTANLWENVGRKLGFFSAGGVLMVEASKHVYAPSGTAVKDRVRRGLTILDGVPQTAPTSMRE